ncbi:CHAD domain-containing protein [Candidatus Nitrospira bockiana]
MARKSAGYTTRHHTSAVRALERLTRGDRRPETLHRLRTSLRRLEAALELLGETSRAATLGESVRPLSRLRTLQVFLAYLEKRQAPARDVRRVARLIDKAQKKIARTHVYETIRTGLTQVQSSALSTDDRLQRLSAARARHAAVLRELIGRALEDPRRKVLHALRLRLKALRYQEEWALAESMGHPHLITALKHAQSLLGIYEERAQFRKFARSLKLKMRTRIAREWRRARKRARRVPSELLPIVDLLDDRIRSISRPAHPASRLRRA